VTRRRRRERTVGILVVFLGIVVLVVALFALREPKGHVTAAQTSGDPSNVARHSQSPSSKPASPSHSPSHPASHAASSSQHSTHGVALIVLNDSPAAGLAEQAANRFQAGGWTITMWGNYQNDISSTCAYYDPNAAGAKAAAEALQAQFPTIKRVEPRFTPDAGAQPLPAGPVVVVLTADYSAT
jgi:hypothetical protein